MIIMSWIPIRLPEKGKEVLFTTNDGHVWAGVWDGKRYFEIDDEGRTIEISEITAWTPLPAPYKEEES